MKKTGKRRFLSGFKYWDIWVLISLLALLELQLATGVKYVKSKPTVSRFIRMNRTSSVNRTNYFVPMSVVTLPTTPTTKPIEAPTKPTQLTTTQPIKLIFHPLTVLETDLDLPNERKPPVLTNSTSKEEGKRMNYYTDFPYHPDYNDNLADEGTISLRITPNDARPENPYPYEKIQRPSSSSASYNLITPTGSKWPFGKESNSGHYAHHYHPGPHGENMHDPIGNIHDGYFETFYDDYEDEAPLKAEASRPPPKFRFPMDSFDSFFRQYKLVAWGIAFGAGSLALLSLIVYVYINNPPTEVVTARRLLDGILDDPRIKQFLDSLTNNKTKKKRAKAN